MAGNGVPRGGTHRPGGSGAPGAAWVGAGVLAALMVLGPVLMAGQPQADASNPAAFLEQLAGEWTVVSEAIPGPGQEPIRAESREVSRFLGEKWLVAETHATSPSGQPVTSILTLGYDPIEDRFVGTYISSMQTHLWSYSGTLDEAGRVLVLETEGPILGDPARTAEYREIIEVTGSDRKLIRSSIRGPDGEWFEFARAEYRRVDRAGRVR